MDVYVFLTSLKNIKPTLQADRSGEYSRKTADSDSSVTKAEQKATF